MWLRGRVCDCVVVFLLSVLVFACLLVCWLVGWLFVFVCLCICVAKFCQEFGGWERQPSSHFLLSG